MACANGFWQARARSRTTQTEDLTQRRKESTRHALQSQSARQHELK